MKSISISAVTLLLASLVACTSNTSPNTDIQHKMSQLDKETKGLIKAAACTSDNQCHSIGFGDKPCGGFVSYRIYSEANTDVALLKSKVSQYNKLSKQWNRENNRVSTCDMLMQPQLTCRNQTCQIK